MSIGQVNAEDLDALVGRELDGRYLLDKFIDRGGFGAVYRGIDKKFNLPVAVKVGLSYREFMKEAKLAAEVRHDHIVQVSDYGNDKGLAYLVMEFLQGEDLEKLFKRQDCRLTPDQLRMFVSEVGDALAHAHADHLIHRDLKPRNIILKQHHTKSGTTSSAGKFVLLDFGIAAKLDSDGTQRNRTQDGAGTIEYMAPELLSLKPTATPQSDIYAFGVILFQMLTGRVPYEQSDTSHIALAEIVGAIIHSPPPRFAAVASDRSYPPAVEELVMQCLEKDPAKRPQSMVEVRDRFLEAFPSPTKPANRRPDYSQTIRPEDLIDTDIPGARGTDSWRPLSEQPAKRGSWLFPTLTLTAILVGVGFFLLRPTSSPYATLTAMRNGETFTADDGNPIDITAGESVTLTFAIEDLPRATVPEFELPGVPGGIHVEMKNGPVAGISKSFLVSIPDLNAAPGQAPLITFRAKLPGGDSPFEKSISLNVRRPQLWLPNSVRDLGFQESSDSRLCRVDSDVLASILERRVAGQAVRFRLAPSTAIGDRRIKSFYIMEQLVTNFLFNEFAKANPEFELQARNQNERTWEVADNHPVTGIYVLEAQRFCQWLAGRDGGLPSTTEWEISAGYYEFLRALKSRFQRSPAAVSSEDLQDFRFKTAIPSLNAEAWLGLGPALNEFHDPRGRVLKECSPYGCQYTRLLTGVRPTEMTGTLVDFTNKESELRELCRHEILTKYDKVLADHAFTDARLRGLGEPTGTSEFRWVKSEGHGLKVKTVEDLNEAGALRLSPSGIALDSYIGFRVVLWTDAESE